MYGIIGKRIKQLRLRQELTQSQLAQKVGVSLSFLGHIERGTRKMSLETFVNITNALDCSPEELIPDSKIWKMDIASLLEFTAERIRIETDDKNTSQQEWNNYSS